jgi:hypothetical protein
VLSTRACGPALRLAGSPTFGRVDHGRVETHLDEGGQFGEPERLDHLAIRIAEGEEPLRVRAEEFPAFVRVARHQEADAAVGLPERFEDAGRRL